ncbi:hypothetical protein K7432_005623 [Basidiobolus ranarum]|uniref:Tetratricopeptide repeat protein n=1 Tax=Basidiobolus ranarum TaxID=34480 RepID=A0ABR2W388_9FUNG
MGDSNANLPFDVLLQVKIFSDAALKFQQEGKHQEAIPLFAQVTSIIENLPSKAHDKLVRRVQADAYWNLATAYLETGNIVKAEFSFNRCLGLKKRKDPSELELEVLEKLVQVNELLGKKELAKNLTKRVEKIRTMLDSREQ